MEAGGALDDRRACVPTETDGECRWGDASNFLAVAVRPETEPFRLLETAMEDQPSLAGAGFGECGKRGRRVVSLSRRELRRYA